MSLSYETAVKLREAGFPQRYHYDHRGICDFPADTKLDPRHPEKWGERVSIPTLSELIEACGEKFHALEQKIFKGIEVDGGKWIAYSNHPNDLGVHAHIFKQGDSPEEAVANLYLAIHK